MVDADGKIDYSDTTRVSYPIYHIDNIVSPVSGEAMPTMSCS